MFSELGPLFKTTFRQAESNDARQKIPHEERDHGQRKQEEEQKKDAPTDLWEDNTTVSVEALRTFLVGFLSTLTQNGNEVTTPLVPETPPASQRPHEASRPTNTRNAKAVRAYQNMAAQGNPPKTQSPPEQLPRKPNAGSLESKELRDIYALIDNLDILTRRGVQELSIKKADSFVDSLKQAVAAIL